MQFPVLGIKAKAHGRSKPPVRELPRPEKKDPPVKNLVARYEVRA